MKKRYVIPVFVPHLGCPHNCIFCNQKIISGQKKELTKDDLVNVLTELKNAITKQFQASFKIDDVDLIFEKEAIEEIANEAIRQKTGARGLRTIVEKMLMDIMFQIPDIKGKKQFTVTKKIVQGKEKNLSDKILQLPDAS